MSNEIRSYEPLTSENAALALVDHQVGLMTGVRDYSTGELKHNVVALAKAAKAQKLPIIVTTTARDSMWGPTFPELVEALPGIEIIDRSSVNPFDDKRVAGTISEVEAIAVWKRESGLRFNPEAFKWWRLFSAVKGQAIWTTAAKEFLADNSNLALAISGYYPARRHDVIIADTLARLVEEGWR